MDNPTKEKDLKMALFVFGIVFLLVYPLGVIWPAGGTWHGVQGTYYFQMICGIYAVLGIFLIAAARNPAANRSLIAFTIWSSVVHAAIMAAQVFSDSQEHGHLIGDVPALLVAAAILWFLAEGGTVCRRHGLTRSEHRFNLSLDPVIWVKPLDLPQFDSMPS